MLKTWSDKSDSLLSYLRYMSTGDSAALRSDDVHLLSDTRHARQVVREVARDDASDSFTVLTDCLIAAVLLAFALESLLGMLKKCLNTFVS